MWEIWFCIWTAFWSLLFDLVSLLFEYQSKQQKREYLVWRCLQNGQLKWQTWLLEHRIIICFHFHSSFARFLSCFSHIFGTFYVWNSVPFLPSKHVFSINRRLRWTPYLKHSQSNYKYLLLVCIWGRIEWYTSLCIFFTQDAVTVTSRAWVHSVKSNMSKLVTSGKFLWKKLVWNCVHGGGCELARGPFVFLQ